MKAARSRRVITSTLLTLVVVPVLYSYLVRERRPSVRAKVEQPVQAGGGPMLGAGMPADRD